MSERRRNRSTPLSVVQPADETRGRSGQERRTNREAAEPEADSRRGGGGPERPDSDHAGDPFDAPTSANDQRDRRARHLAEPVSEPADEQLVSRWLDGDLSAYERLVVRYEARVRRLAYGFVRDETAAEDIAQDTFLQALRRISSLKKAASFRSWLFSIAVNRARDELRHRSRLVESDVEPEDRADTGPTAPSSEDQAAARQLRRILARCIAELPDRYRTPLVLKEVEEMTYAEIASVLGIPMGTAQIRIHRARLRLRERLSGLGIRLDGRDEEEGR